MIFRCDDRYLVLCKQLHDGLPTVPEQALLMKSYIVTTTTTKSDIHMNIHTHICLYGYAHKYMCVGVYQHMYTTYMFLFLYV